jgi:hypothetical protein
MRSAGLSGGGAEGRRGAMNESLSKVLRCAIYTRKSSEHNLELAFNSLDAQREACEAYIKSQSHEGWRLIPGRYADGAFSGAYTWCGAWFVPIGPNRPLFWTKPATRPGNRSVPRRA